MPASGTRKNRGALGAILTQINQKGEHCVIAYASRKLQKQECNYTPFLLEMQAAIWGMDHFGTLLRGRLQEVMNTYDFDIIYKKGSEMPADYLSRNLVGLLDTTASSKCRPFVKSIKIFLAKQRTAARRQMPVPHKTFCK
jgi:hypothetical protein